MPTNPLPEQAQRQIAAGTTWPRTYCHRPAMPKAVKTGQVPPTTQSGGSA